MQIYAACYGAEAGVLALQYMPFRGLYLTGGVTAKTLPFLQKDHVFMSAFFDKGRVSPLLQHVPVYVIRSEDMGQRGAHLRAVQMLHGAKTCARNTDMPAVDPAKDLPPPRRSAADEAAFMRGIREHSSKSSGVMSEMVPQSEAQADELLEDIRKHARSRSKRGSDGPGSAVT